MRSSLQEHSVVLRLRSLRWVWTTLLSITSLVFQSIQLYAIQSAFQNQSGSTNSETQYGFGQLLVFFMVFQLALELLIALHMDFSKPSEEFEELVGRNQIRLGWFMLRFARLLAPMIRAKIFTNQVNHALRAEGIRESVDKGEETDGSNHRWWSSASSRLARVVGQIFSRRPSPSRTDTISLESQQNITAMPVISADILANVDIDLFPQSLSRRQTETVLSSESLASDDSIEPIAITTAMAL
ncbi:hypothetical protein FBEOM_2939 [Fusarium beomiforme]|uniref:Uncharacterized protein n=1 Tax=Fusarium beomiforme TaxID=44412 RepID=A0A9P5ASQ0_9HYPO|nr:hypothetical protein FBEOM_2939 [Fusarium beomiforme]